MNLRELLFGKRIEISSKMDEIAQKLINNTWFVNCGPEHYVDIKTNFKLEQAQTIDEVEKKMAYKKDVKNFVTLDNLFIESRRRGNLFNALYYPQDKNSSIYNKLTATIESKYIKSGFFKPDCIFHSFNDKYNVDVDLYINSLFIRILRDIYYREKYPEYPSFLLDNIDIYLQGKVIIGWIGQFGSHEVNVNEILPILPQEGIINIW